MNDLEFEKSRSRLFEALRQRGWLVDKKLEMCQPPNGEFEIIIKEDQVTLDRHTLYLDIRHTDLFVFLCYVQEVCQINKIPWTAPVEISGNWKE
jgi:hypothetical protein